MLDNIFIVSLFLRGGPIMIPIFICSILALSIVIERTRFYWRNQGNNILFMKKIKKLLERKEFLEAMKLCRAKNSPLANVIAAGIDHLDLKKEHLLDVMRQEGMVQLKKYDRHLGKLSTIASITPLLGLTGTVTGMIASFSVISTIGIGDPTALAGGISQALYTTAAGLMVGIPALVAYNWCESKSVEFAEQVDMYSLEVANLVTTMEVSYEKLAA